MDIKKNSHPNNWPRSVRESNQDSFDLHFERMKAFRKLHEPIVKARSARELRTNIPAAEPVGLKNSLSFLELLKTSYVLNLVTKYGTALLAKNSQN